MEHKPHLDMLMTREQLMEDISRDVEAELDGIVSQILINALTRRLCSSVCKHYPTPTSN